VLSVQDSDAYGIGLLLEQFAYRDELLALTLFRSSRWHSQKCLFSAPESLVLNKNGSFIDLERASLVTRRNGKKKSQLAALMKYLAGPVFQAKDG